MLLHVQESAFPVWADSQLYYGRQISMSELRPGDLIFFSTYEPGASHCGIYLGDGKFIHAGTSTGVVVAVQFYRLLGRTLLRSLPRFIKI